MKPLAHTLVKKAGFTLIEMIMAIVVLGIIGIGTANFITLGTEVYVDAVGRDQVVSQTRYAMERITRDIREALPNSVRVATDGTVNCIEFVPIEASSTYVNVPVLPEASANTVVVVQPPAASVGANKIVVYPLNAADVYTPQAATGNIFSYSGVVASGTGTETVTLDASVLFDADSPTSRYYLVADAVSYCADTSTGELKRYGGYWPTANQLTPTLAVTGVLMAENIAEDVFSYSGATLLANAVVQMTFNIDRLGEVIEFHHEVHLVNVP